MALKTLHIDFRDLGKPLLTRIMAWVEENGISPPLLVIQSGMSLSPEECRILRSQEKNVISAVPTPYHPYLFAARDQNSGEISFPFRENVGEGRRRQDLDPVFLIVPRFALIHDLRKPFEPLLISATAPSTCVPDLHDE